MFEKYFKAEISTDNIKFWFNYLLEEIESLLGRKPSIKLDEIEFSKEDSSIEFEEDPFDFGIYRTYQDGKTQLIFNNFLRSTIKFILLREAFYFFVPISSQNYRLLKAIILVKVADLLKTLPYFSEWENQFDTDPLYAWWKLRFGDYIIQNIKELFDYIHTYSFLFLNFDEEHNLFTEVVIENVVRGYFENTDESEFFSLIYKIFQIKKRYTSRKDFEETFKKLTLENKIKTSFTLKKFNRYFKNFLPKSVISPSYQINWRFFSCQYFYCYLFFNPQIGNYKIQKILEHLPFYYSGRTYESKLSVEVTGYFIIPMSYFDDLKKYFRSLKNYGIIRKYFLFNLNSHENFLNLNYFKKRAFDKKLLLKTDKDYNEDLTFSPSIKYISKKNYKIDLLDVILLNRIRWFSTIGFSFEQKWKQLTKVKSDMFHYLLTQRNNIKDLKKILNLYYFDPKLKERFLDVLRSYKEFGFFYMKEQITIYLRLINFIENILNANPDIINEKILFKNIENYGISPKLDDNLKFKYFKFKENLKNLFFEYFNNNSNYDQIKKDYQNYLNLLEIVEKLKIFNLKVIETILIKKEIAENIYSSKIQKIQKILKEYRLKKIKFQDIDDRLSQIVESDPPGAVPFLITSISTRKICPILYNLLIKDSIGVEEKVDYLKIIFPRVLKTQIVDVISNVKYLQIDLYSMELNDNEKLNLLGLIKNLFNQDLVLFKQFIASYIISSFSILDFFDIENNSFFYTVDLFEELTKYNLALIKDEKIFSNYAEKKEGYIKFKENLAKKISAKDYEENLSSKKDIIVDLEIFQEIEDFHLHLEEYLTKNEDLSNLIRYFKYIKKIDFFPAYQTLDLENYFLYIKPSESNEIDWKMLFPLGFKNLKYTASLESSNSYLFQYIFPLKNPNFSYLNWLVRSKRDIDEYLSFSVKKIIPILNFNFNIGPNGFYFGFQTFEIIAQKILFDKSFTPSIYQKHFNVSEKTDKIFEGKFDIDFQNIINLIDKNLIDMIKLRHKSKLNIIKNLINKKLLFPYITLRQKIGLNFKFCAIVPSLTIEQCDKIIKIFHFLNYGFIFEIEGEFYSKEENKIFKFEKGLYLEFYLPNSDFNNFKRIISNIFNYFKIEHYLLFFDLIKGDLFVNNLFKKFKHPNPMGCHLWDKNIKKWRNYKSLTQKFEFIYPEIQGNSNP